MRLKPFGKLIVLIVVIGVAAGAWRLTGHSLSSLMPGAATTASSVPTKVDLGSRQEAPGTSGGGSIQLPGSEPGSPDKPEVRMLGYAWNAQMGLMFANGGPQATAGSLMSKHGVNLKWARQDDNGKMQEALVAFATQLSQGNANPDKGVHFVTIMGDGGASFLKGLNDTLKRLGPEYQAKIVGTCGYSHGEDKFMGPAEWKANPSASRGGFCAGVIRDGDWNIAQKWLGDNGLRNNPDEKTYDPDALNWVNASDYMDAPQKYVAGYAEDRPVVHNGKRTGETRHLVVDSVVTWTPGDVTVAQKKGGLVSIVSTKEYSSQMPCVVIGIDKWMRANRSTVDAMLRAICEGGDAVKSNPAALHKAAEISAVCYHEPNSGADYWEKYYKGTQETDKTGAPVELGGSSVNNVADNLLAFGLVPGSANLVAATYKVFGDVDVQQYRSLMASYPPADQVIDTSYVQDVARQIAPTAPAMVKARPSYDRAQGIKTAVSRKAWNIHFHTGSAAFAPDAQADLNRLRRDILVASGAVVEIHGHTDNVGDANKNMQLSEARAFAVKQWLQHTAPVNFPNSRLRVFAHGAQNPLAPNSSEAGRAQNRRVEVVIGTTGQ